MAVGRICRQRALQLRVIHSHLHFPPIEHCVAASRRWVFAQCDVHAGFPLVEALAARTHPQPPQAQPPQALPARSACIYYAQAALPLRISVRVLHVAWQRHQE